jgi:nucleolar protein 14
MDPEEKMLERFAREKHVRSLEDGLTKKRSRGSSLYNLEDDAQLTHFGQSLAEMDDFGQEDLIGVSDDDGDIKEDVVRQDHFGGDFDAESDQDPDRVKTKSEVMAEVMAKSKMYKHERQQQHDQDLDEIEALDADVGDLQGLLRSIKPAPRDRVVKSQEMVSYDTALREMVYDQRSKPTERTKTDYEIAEEEMEKLKVLEDERLRRMRGEEVDVEEKGPRQRGQREGDDLDDDFVPDDGEADYYGFGKGAPDKDEVQSDPEETSTLEGESGSEEEAQADGKAEGDDADSDDGVHDIAEYFTDEEEVNGVQKNEELEDAIVPAAKKLRLAEQSTTNELAYTFPCPSTFEEMLDILKDVPTSSIPTVIERIEILYSTKLLSVNREKLEVLPHKRANIDFHTHRAQTAFTSGIGRVSTFLCYRGPHCPST